VRLSRRVRKLEAAPPVRRGPQLPRDPVAFARAFLAGEFKAEDIDPCDPDHTGWLCQMHVFLMELGPEHQAWLKAQRELDPRAYPDALLMPASDEVILAALDETMRRG
jgi:hypothetical protein